MKKHKNMVTPLTLTPKGKEAITLTPSEKAVIAVIEKRVIDLKCKLANLVIQQLQVSQDVVLAEKELIDKINEVARTHGITAENAGRWNFDTNAMIFTERD